MCNKAFASLITAVIVVALGITLISSRVSGQTNITSLPYEGVSDAIGLPIIQIFTENGSRLTEFGPQFIPLIYSENGNVNLTLLIDAPYSVYSPSGQGTVGTLLVALTSVSYKASWQGNQSIELYNFYIPTPAILTGNPPNTQTELSYNLTNVPYGEQHLEVDAACGGYVWGYSVYSSFSGNSSNTLDFTVAPPNASPNPITSPSPSPNPSPSQSPSTTGSANPSASVPELPTWTSLPLILVVISITGAVFARRKHRKQLLTA